ncbi:GNAT family N-acetyltransferase [Vagococcus bubulae]|uniref:N-acetyltransferase domain-containing protein n=1 Tax=Vagococcus bubulae TaxID=1977868 RepID=A0A429Z9Y4_9ENTE|nr:GNAT family N-acetyltransferase [Vagococcus bubulae]RST90519.1 hypothetical protein CBF36_11900 [Vagococcus bubulae]
MIRFAQKEDASQAIDLVMIVLKDMELDIFEKLSDKEVKELLVSAYIDKPTHRYGYKNAIVKEIDGKIAGVAFGYPHHHEKTIDDGFYDILEQNNLPKDYRLFTEEEAFDDEWYLDTLVTSPKFRGQGVAKELLNSLPDLAKQTGLTTIGLNVDKINDNAKRIYLNNGFEKVGETNIAGHEYEHLQKNIS